jgi:uncharacterized NAD(P)/FAD-binding protein YdhS
LTCASIDAPSVDASDRGAERARPVVVVGGGAAATAFLCSLAKQVSAVAAARAPDVVVFEPKSPCGPGVAFGEDTEVALLNRPVSSMSVDYGDRGHFRRWLAHHEPAVARTGRNGSFFVPRPCFGRYLADEFDTACAEIANLGGSVQVVRRRVDAVLPEAEGIAVHAGGSTHRARNVVLCLGSVPAPDVYGLRDAPGYLHQPYPLSQLDNCVGRGSRVLVLGAGLTAIDVALALAHRTEDVRVTLASRSGLLPDVRSEFGAGDGATRLIDDVRAELDAREQFTVADLVRLLDVELARQGTSLREALRPFLARAAGVDILRSRLADSGPAATVQRCVVALTPWYSRLWRAFDHANRKKFVRRYGRLFTCLRSPMPPVSARRLIGLHGRGALAFRAGVVDVRRDGPGFQADFRGADNAHFDMAVNATGRGIDVSNARPGSLVERLVRGGHASAHPLGGLDVSPATNEVLDSRSEPVEGLHVVGDLSSGVHFHTSSMEYVATQASKVAAHLVEHLTEQAEALA